MSNHEGLKGELPRPYNQDLSQVFTHLNRRTRASRERLANNPVTAGYMAAAVRLVGRHLGPDPERIPADPRDENSVVRAVLSFISQRAVVEELQNNPYPLPRQGSVATMRSTWGSHSDFIADLINFSFWPGNRPDGREEQLAAGREKLLQEPNVAQAVHDMAYLTVSDVPRTTFRLSHVAMCAADGDKTITDAIVRSYEEMLGPWKEIYTAFLEAKSLRLRPGITIDDIANMLSVLIDGLMLRTVGDPSAGLIDHDQQRTLLGTVALALIYSFAEPAGNESGQTLEQAVQQKIHGSCDSRKPVG